MPVSHDGRRLLVSFGEMGTPLVMLVVRTARRGTTLGSLGSIRWVQTLFSVFAVIEIAGQSQWPKTIGRLRRNEYSPCDVDGSNCSMLA